ncbi:MAG: hypothetical protein ABEJ80_05910 [Halarchaeum sp.]
MDDGPTVRRRDVLAVAALAALAGCSDLYPPEESAARGYGERGFGTAGYGGDGDA